jgi:sugar lactone lactonase YvrE
MGQMKITQVKPKVGLPGGTVEILGEGFDPWEIQSNHLHFGQTTSWIKGISEDRIITQVPPDGRTGEIYIEYNGSSSNRIPFCIPEEKIGGLYQMDNPVLAADGFLYTALSGPRGESTPTSVYQINLDTWEKHPYIQGIMNVTSLVMKSTGELFACSRQTGKIYRILGENEYEVFSQGLGAAFGLAVNSKDELYVGDRNGTIFRVDNEGQATFFATLPQSYIGYHLVFNSDDELFVTAPTHMGENYIQKLDQHGKATPYFSGHNLLHGFCFDGDGNIYIAEGKRFESHIIKITPDLQKELVVSGQEFIGVLFDYEDNLLISSRHHLYQIHRDYVV